MNIKNPILLMIVAAFIIIFGGIFFVNASTQSTPQNNKSNLAKASVVGSANYSWGKIAYAGPKATKSFVIKNIGKDMLQLSNIRTSCHCTKAYLTIDKQVSPEFGMDMGSDGTSSYIGNVQPGKEAKLTVVFDQSFHGPEGVGPITRFVEVDTNDKSNPQLTFTLTGNVIKN